MIKRVEDVNAQNAITRKDLHRLMVEMARGVDKALDEIVKDPVTCDTITKRISVLWNEISLQ